MTKEQAQTLKSGDKIRLTETLTVLDPCCNGNEYILADTPSGHLVFVEPHEAQLAEPAPKYDPCRLFRKGDKVRVVECNGRNHSGVSAGKIGIVDDDEHPNDPETIEVVFDGDDLWGIEACYLELVTPVEELEPYCVNLIYDCDDGTLIGYEVAHENGVKETIFYGGKGCIRTLSQAKEAAEAERDRLNDEYRKEQK